MFKGTQAERLLYLLSDGKYHSSLEIRNDLYIMASAGVIFQLKKEGHSIKKKMMPVNPWDMRAGTPIAWYKLENNGRVF